MAGVTSPADPAVGQVPRVTAENAAEGGAALRRLGAVVIDGAFDPATIDALRASVMARQPEFADRSLLTDWKDNGDGRFIAPVLIDRAIYDSGVLGSPALAAIAAAALGDDWVVDAFGVTMAYAGCPAQRVHRDGFSIYPETPLSAMLPAFALTVMIPLVDVNADGGVTSFRLGSNHYDERLEKAELVSTTLERGSLIAWDFEVLHRGEANTSQIDRPMLYFTLCRPFWTDMANFGGAARVRLIVAEDVVPLLDRRYARAAEGAWAHLGIGERLAKIAKAGPGPAEPPAASAGPEARLP
jgi:hypothetical protein